MLGETRFIQETIRKLIKIIVPKHPIDIGKFTVRLLKDILLEHKDELGLDFDDIIIHPGPQPRESADIELIKGNKITGKINVKTAVSGDLKVALRRLVDTIKAGESGIIIITSLFYKNREDVEAKMIIIYMPEELLKYYKTSDIYDVILEKIEEKITKEGYKKAEFLALNEALELERTKLSVEAKEEASEAKKLAEEARDEAKKAREEASEGKKLAKEAKDEIKEVRKIVEKLDKKLDKLFDKFNIR